MRFVRGLGEGLRPRIDRLASLGPFESLSSFVLRAGLPRPVLENLAAAGAFDGFGLERREALWEVGRLASATEHGPLFAGVTPVAEKDAPALEPATTGEKTALDYHVVGVGFGPHPVRFVRELLKERGGLRSDELSRLPPGRRIVSGGLVICRQRPSAAGGTLFLTLEDEKGFVNVVVREALFKKHRRLLRSASLLEVRGKLERSGPVINVLADGFASLPVPAEGFAASSHDFH